MVRGCSIGHFACQSNDVLRSKDDDWLTEIFTRNVFFLFFLGGSFTWPSIDPHFHDHGVYTGTELSDPSPWHSKQEVLLAPRGHNPIDFTREINSHVFVKIIILALIPYF